MHALRYLTNEVQQLSKDIAQCERMYLDLGVEYFYTWPMEARDELCSEHRDKCYAAFIVIDDKDPELVSCLHQLRSLKDEVRAAAWRGDVDAGREKMLIADDRLDYLKDMLVFVEFVLGIHDCQFRTRFDVTEFSSYGIPTSEQSNPVKFRQLREWIDRR